VINKEQRNKIIIWIISPILIIIGIMIFPLMIFKRILSGEQCGGW